jgi:hypothetical protein
MIVLHVKCRLFLSDFNKLELSHIFSNKPKISNFMIVHAVQSFHVDRQAETTNLTVVLVIM